MKITILFLSAPGTGNPLFDLLEKFVDITNEVRVLEQGFHPGIVRVCPAGCHFEGRKSQFD
jgi:hypothetical protein